MTDKRTNFRAFVALICCILPLFLAPLFVFAGFSLYTAAIVVVISGIISLILAIIAIIKREPQDRSLMQKKRAFLWILAIIVCFILPFVFIYAAGFLWPMVRIFPLPLVVIGGGIIVGIITGSIGILKGELRGSTLVVLIVFVLAVPEVILGILGVRVGRSCGPSVYTFDGKEYVLDSEPYAGAILAEQTRYSELNHLAAVNGRYQLKMTNELDETQYTDELKLIVAEHPIRTDIVAEVTGQIHTIASPVRPSYACELPGTDILYLLSEKDDRFWEGGSTFGSFGSMVGQRKELILEFPKPQNATKAKLVMNVCNTEWASSISSQFLEYFGNCYPVMGAARSWARKGLIRFEVQAWENGKWTSRGWIRGASPHLPKDQVIVMDVSAIESQSLKLRLMPAAGFWRMDSVIVDYSEDLPVTVTELEASEAVNSQEQDITEMLKGDDDNFYVTEKGDYAMITFNEPPLSSFGMARSYILRAKGYYRIHTSNVTPASATWP